MKKRNFVIDRMLYEVLGQGQLRSFTIKTLRDLYADRLEAVGACGISLSKVRLYVYQHLRRMIKAGWVKPDSQQKVRNQLYHLLDLPKNLTLQLVAGTLVGRNGKSQATWDNLEPPAMAEKRLTVLRSQLKELELDMLAAMGEVERYKLLIQDMPDLASRLQKPYQSAREQSSKLIGHFRAVENTLVLLQAD